MATCVNLTDSEFEPSLLHQKARRSNTRLSGCICSKSLRNLGSMQRMSSHAFFDLEKAYNRVPQDKLQRVLQEYGIDGHLLVAITSLYCQPEVCVRVNGKPSKSFYVGVGFWHGYVLSSLLFIICMNWMDTFSRTDECVTIGRYKFSRLLFTDDLVLLAFSESGFQHALNSCMFHFWNENQHFQN